MVGPTEVTELMEVVEVQMVEVKLEENEVEEWLEMVDRRH